MRTETAAAISSNPFILRDELKLSSAPSRDEKRWETSSVDRLPIVTHHLRALAPSFRRYAAVFMGFPLHDRLPSNQEECLWLEFCPFTSLAAPPDYGRKTSSGVIGELPLRGSRNAVRSMNLGLGKNSELARNSRLLLVC